jgi:hypothetical protein
MEQSCRLPLALSFCSSPASLAAYSQLVMILAISCALNVGTNITIVLFYCNNYHIQFHN